MSISSISFTFFSMVGAAPAAAPVATATAAANDAVAPAVQSAESHDCSHGRRNVLYEAMMAALREMGLTAGPAQPAPAQGAPAPGPMPAPAAGAPAPSAASPSPVAAGSGVAVPAEPAAAPTTSVEDAVFSFAHALWQALRGGESGDSRREDRHGDDHEGHHGHRRHGHGHGEGYAMSRGYSGLATRLEALAVRFDAGAGAVDPTPASPISPDAGTVLPAVVPAPVVAQTSEPAPAPASTPASVASASPLAQAFDAMMRVLRAINPNAPSADAAAPSLASFLYSLSRGLNADRTTPMLSGVGVVINVSA